MKLTRPIVFFDLETTGVDVEKDRIVSLAAVKVYPDGRKETKNRLINPVIKISKEAFKIHGISNDDIKDCPIFKQLAHGIHAFFKDCDVGGYNIMRFDLPLIAKEFERCGIDFVLDDVKIVDVYRIFIDKEPRDLESALKFYCNESHDEAHNALGDVNATLKVLDGQFRAYEDLGQDVDTLHSVSMGDSADITGRLKYDDEGDIVINFGKNKGLKLKNVDRGYIRWMIQNNVVFGKEKLLKEFI